MEKISLIFKEESSKRLIRINVERKKYPEIKKK